MTSVTRNNENNNCKIVSICPQCKTRYEYEATPEQLELKMIKNLPIQDCFPTMDIDMRELLINGLFCGKCFDSMFEKEQ